MNWNYISLMSCYTRSAKQLWRTSCRWSLKSLPLQHWYISLGKSNGNSNVSVRCVVSKREWSATLSSPHSALYWCQVWILPLGANETEGDGGLSNCSILQGKLWQNHLPVIHHSVENHLIQTGPALLASSATCPVQPCGMQVPAAPLPSAIHNNTYN